MIVLALDTATGATAVALRTADGAVSEARDDPPGGAHPGHATRLLELAESLLGQAGMRFSELERIAVGTGPGTFTGLRVGIATARALAQAGDVELVGVSSLTALAWGVGAERGAELNPLAVIDARRGEVFAAAYVGDGLRPVSEPQALAPDRLGGLLASAAHAAGGPHEWLAVGDGAVRYRAELEEAGIELAPEDSPLHRVPARGICELGAEAAPGELGAVLPDYRRRPDAELALQARAAGS